MDFASCCFYVAEDEDDFDDLLVSFNGLIDCITTDLTVTVVAFEDSAVDFSLWSLHGRRWSGIWRFY